MGGASNADQVYHMVLSCGFGFLVGGYYDIFRLLRKWLPARRWIVFWQDILFFSTTAVATFLFDMTMTGGKLRFYLFAGMITGFVTYRVTVGRFAVSLLLSAGKRIACAWRWLGGVLLWPFRILWRILCPVVYKQSEKWRKIRKKVGEFFKKGLKRIGGLLYNDRWESVPNQTGKKAGGDSDRA